MNAQEFAARWRRAGGAERANYQIFINELCDLLALPKPNPTLADNTQNDYVFERSVVRASDDGSSSTNFIDLYKRGCFVLETKQGVDRELAEEQALSTRERGKAATRKRGHGVRETASMMAVLIRAKQQAERYARLLPADEGRPPFLLVVDVGATIEVYAEFTRTGGVYTPFPDATSHRIPIERLGEPAIQDRLRLIWTDPLELDPARRSARVTRDIAAALAKLAQRLEATGHPPADVAQFLMRCLFTMFAEDVKLLPPNSFLDLLVRLRSPANFRPMVEALWGTMNTGGFSPILQEKLLRFNGGLFADPRAIDLNGDQLALLTEAAAAKWAEVEPAIFGTLLERALDPIERHKLGAHYTPRAYVERLVIPTVIEPLRADWEAVQAAAMRLDGDGKHREAAAEVEQFHQRLCQVRVLDPACGSGNFLYVALELMKRLEGEVLDFLGRLQGAEQTRLQTGTVTVDPHQFLGIEVNPRAAAIAELVLWIGYLQWHFRTHGEVMPPEPVIRNFRNIENRDAILAWDRIEPVLDDHGQPVTRWDGRSMKKSPVTGEDIPDDSKRIPVMKYINPRKAEWPEAEYIVGNPPFIGDKRMRDALGPGYVDALWSVHDDMPKSADYVLYWWNQAARMLKLVPGPQRFGFITTNSVRHNFSNKVLSTYLNGPEPLSLIYAVPDHPWVDAEDGAAVRIAMTVAAAGVRAGKLEAVVVEIMRDTGEFDLSFRSVVGRINPDLTTGTNVYESKQLRANSEICCNGVALYGAGFMLDEVSREEVTRADPKASTVLKRLVRGKDITDRFDPVWVIDAMGISEDELRVKHPAIYQRLYTRVKPERDQNNRVSYRRLWWIFGEPRIKFRPALRGLRHFFCISRVSKHPTFIAVDGASLPESGVVAVGHEDFFILGVLSSEAHAKWAVRVGSSLEDRPRYNKSNCFENFPFPDPPAALRSRIRDLGEQLDAHRKRQQALHPTLTMTGMYNVLEKLRSGEALTAKERVIHEQGLVSVLRQIHDDLDAAVLEAYGWSDLATLHGEAFTEELLARLVALNRERAEEEARGVIRWLRPEFQNAGATEHRQEELEIETETAPASRKKGGKAAKATAEEPATPWPSGLLAQTQAIRGLLQAARGPLSPEQLARRFVRAPRARVEEILETLVALGQATRDADGAYQRG
ncbi:class I SAM-dependent DNA methyltransferase [bacterium]|nr:class I SAM-dependent DNA methyltransferase [bacterium]